jgi:hypothetical protein
VHEITDLSSYVFFIIYTTIPILGIIGTLFWPSQLKNKEYKEMVDDLELKEPEITENPFIEKEDDEMELPAVEDENLEIEMELSKRIEIEKSKSNISFFQRLFNEIRRIFQILKQPKIITFFFIYFVQSLWLNTYIASAPSRLFTLANGNQELSMLSIL